MKGPEQQPDFLIGWDVGGWDCDRNPRSRDALVILDKERNLLGQPWRGNLRRCINEARSSASFLDALLELCAVPSTGAKPSALLAIDAPLAFSGRFVELISKTSAPDEVWASDSNPYIYRETERFLISRGHRPLSPVKDMIGSQATKARHVLARFTPEMVVTGVWSDGEMLTVIEAYPSVAHKSPHFETLRMPFIQAVGDGSDFWHEGFDHSDQTDALSCALLAWLFVHEPSRLAQPEETMPTEEGWIWVPVDALGDERGLLLERCYY